MWEKCENMRNKGIFEALEKTGVIPVVVLEDDACALPLAKALKDGGINCAEITFRTNAAVTSIRAITDAYPDMLVGAGTVLTVVQAAEAMKAGAKFIVTPGYSQDVVAYCIKQNFPVIPGCMDTYTIQLALAAGLEVVKFFPAEAAGGIKMLKALSAPYRMLKFMPTGGINENNVRDYLNLDSVIACGGSWMADPKLIAYKAYDEITLRSKNAMACVYDARKKRAYDG